MQSYGVMPNGAAVDLYTLGKEAGLLVQVITYGGTIVGIEVPDRKGVCGNVVLALPSLAEYVAQDGYLGALVAALPIGLAARRSFSMETSMSCPRTRVITVSMVDE